MHRVIFMVLLIVVSGCNKPAETSNQGKTEINPASNAANDQRTPAIAFEKLVNTAYNSMTADQPVTYFDSEKAWTKRRYTVSNATYDVKKTDSLLNPIVGFVSFNIRIDESALVNSKEEALRTTTFDERSRHDVSVNYSYKDGAWKFNNSHVKIFFDGELLSDLELSEEEIMSNKYIVPLHYWMPRE